MAFQPVIEACIHTNCTYLKVTDVTGDYDVSLNPKGWDNASSLLVSDVASVILTVTDPSGTSTIYDVTDQITSPIPGDIIVLNELGTYLDGIYTLTYVVTDDLDNTYTHTLRKLFTCNTRCCVDKMWAKIPAYVGSKDYDTKVKDCILAETLLSSLSCAAATLTLSVVDNILTRIERLCNFNDCGCN